MADRAGESRDRIPLPRRTQLPNQLSDPPKIVDTAIGSGPAGCLKL